MLRLSALGLATWAFVDAAIRAGHSPGLSNFGRPGLLAPLLWLAALGFAAALLTAADRRSLARRLTLLVLMATLLSGRLLPAQPGLITAILGITLVTAAPLLRIGLTARVACLALAAAIPALVGSLYPHGGWIWLADCLPALGLAVLLPSLFDRNDVRTPVVLLILATGAACLVALTDYVSLMQKLDVPLATVLRTRLRLLDTHPNLVVPHLAATLVLGAALVLPAFGFMSLRGRSRKTPGAARKPGSGLVLLALVPCAAALYFVRSRTGFLVTGAGLVLLLGLLRPGRVTRGWQPLAAFAVLAAILIPCTNLVDDNVSRLESNKASKAWIFRAYMWGMGRDTVAAAPWHGFGPHTRYVQGRYAEPGRYDGLNKDDHPHNVGLLTGEALGWPGLAALALLLGLSLRRPRGEAPLSLACGAALIAVWAANAIDLGGADRTMYPTLVLVLLGLRAAAERAPVDDPKTPTPATATWRWGVTAAAVPMILLGLALAVGEQDKQAVTRQLLALERADRAEPSATRSPRPPPHTQAQVAEMTARLQRADLLLPFDPEVSVLMARLARLQADTAGALKSYRQATERMAAEPTLLYELARAQAANGLRDPYGQLESLEQVVALDPHGANVWHVQLELASLHMQVGHRSAAIQTLVDALLTNPGAAARFPRVDTPEGVHLDLDPFAQPAQATDLVSFATIQEEIVRRADEGTLRRATGLRLRMRQVEIAQALQLGELADTLAGELLAGQPQYLALRRAAGALQDERWQAAEDALAAHGPQRPFRMWVDTLEARSHLAPLDVAAFEFALERALATLDDIKFEAQSFARLLAARQLVAERQGDVAAASRYADGIDFVLR